MDDLIPPSRGCRCNTIAASLLFWRRIPGRSETSCYNWTSVFNTSVLICFVFFSTNSGVYVLKRSDLICCRDSNLGTTAGPLLDRFQSGSAIGLSLSLVVFARRRNKLWARSVEILLFPPKRTVAVEDIFSLAKPKKNNNAGAAVCSLSRNAFRDRCVCGGRGGATLKHTVCCK